MPGDDLTKPARPWPGSHRLGWSYRSSIARPRPCFARRTYESERHTAGSAGRPGQMQNGRKSCLVQASMHGSPAWIAASPGWWSWRPRPAATSGSSSSGSFPSSWPTGSVVTSSRLPRERLGGSPHPRARPRGECGFRPHHATIRSKVELRASRFSSVPDREWAAAFASVARPGRAEANGLTRAVADQEVGARERGDATDSGDANRTTHAHEPDRP